LLAAALGFAKPPISIAARLALLTILQFTINN